MYDKQTYGFLLLPFFATNENPPKKYIQPTTKSMIQKVDTATIDAPSDGQIYNAKAISDFFQKLEKMKIRRIKKSILCILEIRIYKAI